MPAVIAVNIPSNTPPVFAVVFAALIGIGGRFGIIANADLGAYISFLCSAVSFGASGVGSVFTLTNPAATFCAAIIARVLFALGIVEFPATITRRGLWFFIKPARTLVRHTVALSGLSRLVSWQV